MPAAMPSDADVNAAIALTRFGLGARSGEIDRTRDPRGWLEGQIRPSGAANPPGQFENSTDRMQAFLDYQRDARQVRQARQDPAPGNASPQGLPQVQPTMGAPSASMASAPDANQAAFDARRDSRRNLVQDTAHEFLARTQWGATTDAGFAERWALFWANGFTVSATKFQSAVFIGQYEREAIRPHVFGKFEDLAVAAEQHPAMLLYLDQAQSIGPDSRAGQRRNAGLNENLAREIMELHTVGADGGYTQADVTEFARALTGWSAPSLRDPDAGANGFVYRANVHEPGARTVLGKTHSEGEKDQGETILRDLANRPQTARRLARKIAAHFVADDPPPSLVAKLEKAWMDSGGDLAVVARTLVTAPESWEPRPAKIKTPYEFIVSTHRALGTTPQRPQPLQAALLSMGQPAFSAPSPEGWPDTAADWAGPDALVKRLDWSKAVADLAQSTDPDAVAAEALGVRLGERTRLAVARAESRPEALTLFLMSPEFQRR
jgi:uncharacterized protein (DUF1800 family)